MNKKFTPYLLVLLIVVTLTFLNWYMREHTAESTIVSEQDCECHCPSLDELLRKEMPEASIKLEAPIKVEEKNIVLSSEKNGIQEDEKKGIRIVLRYDDKDTLLRKAKLYGLTTTKPTSQLPYYFTLERGREKLYFAGSEAFRRFLLDIGGREILSEAQKEVVVRLVSGSKFELIEYQ
ncbi:hypothetical protein MYX76_09555 [Desulfobacterota bacterium AH_259_B03_O07]|nr:hypothetical protein [Desulfobacterota bacterium AH_259_B03_O07]